MLLEPEMRRGKKQGVGEGVVHVRWFQTLLCSCEQVWPFPQLCPSQCSTPLAFLAILGAARVPSNTSLAACARQTDRQTDSSCC